MIENLHPISGNHSISRVVAAIHIPQEVLRPDEVLKTLVKNEKLKKFQKRSTTATKSVNITQTSIGVSQDERIVGFILEEYDDNGKVKNILRLNNNQNQSTITLENRSYEDWDVFYSEFISVITELNEIINLFIEAISLTYVDDFLWRGENKIEVKKVFNVKSELLNKKFLGSTNGTIISLTQESEQGLNSEEQTEISFNNIVKRISINHQYAISFGRVEPLSSMLENTELKLYFDKAHDKNKLMLKDVLSKDCLERIDIK